ncbi:MAG: hypothetical protein ACI4L9_03985, partial [Candidatus Coproplasma sp.]
DNSSCVEVVGSTFTIEKYVTFLGTHTSGDELTVSESGTYIFKPTTSGTFPSIYVNDEEAYGGEWQGDNYIITLNANDKVSVTICDNSSCVEVVGSTFTIEKYSA